MPKSQGYRDSSVGLSSRKVAGETDPPQSPKTDEPPEEVTEVPGEKVALKSIVRNCIACGPNRSWDVISAHKKGDNTQVEIKCSGCGNQIVHLIRSS